MPVAPEDVWDALADAGNFGYWVVGSKLIREVESGWPEAGSKFHHTVGLGPIRISDHTTSLDARPPRLLQMRAKARPAGTARVTMVIDPIDGGTLVRMKEDPDGLVSFLALNPLVQLLTRGRNTESLMRLEELALRRSARRKQPDGVALADAPTPYPS